MTEDTAFGERFARVGAWIEAYLRDTRQYPVLSRSQPGDLTRALPAAYVRVPREGAAARFLPVKDPDELARRAPQIQAALRARKIL